MQTAQGRKAFFFGKKKQKTFVLMGWCRCDSSAHVEPAHEMELERQHNQKSFGSFLQKRTPSL
jgi:hypothetical protein